MLPSVLILSAAAVVALVLTLARPISDNEVARHAAARSLALAVALLAVASGGYFPGLVTSPFIGVASAFLWIRLRRATRRDGS